MNGPATSTERDSPFKTCSCGRTWPSRQNFLSDRATKLIGYQVDFDEIGLGLFLFNHLDCGTTLSFKVRFFFDLYDGPVYSTPLRNRGTCPEYCFHKEELGSCAEECECAFVREILKKINEWPKYNSR